MLPALNILHIIGAAFAAFVVGTIYYLPPVMGDRWGTLVKAYGHLKDEDIKPSPMKPVVWMITALVNAAVYQFVFQLCGFHSFPDALLLAFILWIGYGASFSAWPMIFARWPAGVWLINNIAFLLMQIAIAAVTVLWPVN